MTEYDLTAHCSFASLAVKIVMKKMLNLLKQQKSALK